MEKMKSEVNLISRSGNSEDEVGREVSARHTSVFDVAVLSEEVLFLHHSQQTRSSQRFFSFFIDSETIQCYYYFIFYILFKLYF